MTTKADIAVMEAQSALRNAEAQLAKEHKEELIERLASTRSDLKEKRARYLKLAGAIKERREERSRLQHAIRMHNDVIAAHMRERPECADYLPLDPEVAKWRTDHISVLNERDELLRMLDAAPEPSTLETAILERDISTLEYAERNLLRALDPHAGDWLKGGLFRVNYV